MRLIAPVRRLNSGASGWNSPISWGIRAVGADTCPFTGERTVVAVLDTGIDRSHRAFDGIHLIERDFTGEGDGDKNGHGTHCAATIFGRDVEGVRIGVARGVRKALIAKVIGAKGASTEHIVNAIYWAVEHGAQVISMSLAIDFAGYQAALQGEGLKPEAATSRALEAYRATIRLFDRLAAFVTEFTQFRLPCLLIAAAGNESRRQPPLPYEIAASPPAASEGFIAVAALRKGADGFEVADFSNTGAAVAAPGVDIVSAKAGGGLVSFDGTSMAVPHVAGVAALWAGQLAASGPFDTRLFVTRLLGSATRSLLAPSPTFGAVGAGLVRAPQA